MVLFLYSVAFSVRFDNKSGCCGSILSCSMVAALPTDALYNNNNNKWFEGDSYFFSVFFFEDG